MLEGLAPEQIGYMQTTTCVRVLHPSSEGGVCMLGGVGAGLQGILQGATPTADPTHIHQSPYQTPNLTNPTSCLSRDPMGVIYMCRQEAEVLR